METNVFCHLKFNMSGVSTDELFGGIAESLDWIGDIFLNVEKLSDDPNTTDFDFVSKIREMGSEGKLYANSKEEVIEKSKQDLVNYICSKADIDSYELLEEWLRQRDYKTDEINDLMNQLKPYLEFELIEKHELEEVEVTQDDILAESALTTVEENVADGDEVEDLNTKTKSELKEMAKELGLSMSGNKNQLIEKIEAKIEIENKEEEETNHYEIGDMHEFLQFDDDDDEIEENHDHDHDENCNHEDGCDEDCMHEHMHDDPTYHPQENMGEVTVEVEENHSLTQINVKGNAETFVEQVRMWSLLAEFWDDEIDILKHVKEETTGQLLFERMTNLIESGKVSTKAEFFTGIGLMFEMKPKDVVKLFTLLEKLE